MLGFAARLIGGVVSPLIDQVSASSARLLRKLALFVVAALALVVVLTALTIAFDLWIANLAGPIAGALAVAGLYLVVALTAVFLALRPGATKAAAQVDAAADRAAAASKQGRDADIDEFAAPLLKMLQSLGLRKEQLAVLAGTAVAKHIGPIPLLGLAIVAGFLIGRMGGGLRGLSDLVTSLMASDLLSALFGAKPDPNGEAPAAERDAA